MPDLEVAEALDTTAGVETEVQDTSTESTELETAQETTDDAQITEQETDVQPELETQANEKGVPAKYKDIFAKDKDLRFAYMGYQALRREFPGGVKEAREFRDIANEIGGREGIEAMQADRNAITEMDKKLDAGDPSFVEGIAEEFPDGFGKLVPHILETLSKRDSATYSHLMGRVILNTLDNSPIHDIYEALKTDKPEAAQKLAQWYNGIKDLASKVPERKIDPEREKLNKERTEFQEQKVNEFKTSVTGEIKTANATALDTELRKIFKANGKDYGEFKKKNPDVATEMLNKAYQNLIGELNKDSSFVKQHNDLLERQQRQKLVDLMKSKSALKVPDAVKKAYRLFNLGADKKTVVNANPNGNVGTLKVSKMPSPEQIDWDRASQDEMLTMIAKNTAFIKGRKEKISWN